MSDPGLTLQQFAVKPDEYKQGYHHALIDLLRNSNDMTIDHKTFAFNSAGQRTRMLSANFSFRLVDLRDETPLFDGFMAALMTYHMKELAQNG